MALSLRLLRIFLVAAEHNNFSRAAEILYVSQPAVSKSIQELEQQVGLTLFDRSRRVLALTEAGHLLYQYAQHLFAVEKAAEIALDQLKGLERGHLALGASRTIGTYLLPPLLSRFHRAYPGIQLSLEIANSQTILKHLHTKPLDLAFVEGPVKDSDFDVSVWGKDHLAVIVASDCPLLSEQPVPLQRLANESYIQRESGSGTREIVDAVFEKHGLQPDIVMELESNQAVKQAVIAGLGFSIVSQATIKLEFEAGVLAVVSLSDCNFDRSLWQVTSKGRPRSPAAVAFEKYAAQ
jgi:DNA-binding transcriptional LysR family regulator